MDRMVFIDTGAFVAKFLKKDQRHQDALSTWEDLHINKKQCITSNFVLDELFTLLGRWTNHQFAADKAELIYSSGFFTILRPDNSDEIEAVRLFKKYAKDSVSFTDCISFQLMRKNNIKRVFTFDQHFMLAGFSIT